MRDTTPSVPATDLHRDEVDHAFQEEAAAAAAVSGQGLHPIRLEALAGTTSSEHHASWVCVRWCCLAGEPGATGRKKFSTRMTDGLRTDLTRLEIDKDSIDYGGDAMMVNQ